MAKPDFYFATANSEFDSRTYNQIDNLLDIEVMAGHSISFVVEDIKKARAALDHLSRAHPPEKFNLHKLWLQYGECKVRFITFEMARQNLQTTDGRVIISRQLKSQLERGDGISAYHRPKIDQHWFWVQRLADSINEREFKAQADYKLHLQMEAESVAIEELGDL
jgi:hypothetical protein